MTEKSDFQVPIWLFWKQRRYVVILLCFLGFFNLYSLRVNLSVAIVPMTTNRTTIVGNTTIIEGPEFDWDSKFQGYVLSSFYYGYIATQIFGGYLSTKFGGKVVFAVSIGVTSILTLLTPLLASVSVYLLLALRILEGLAEGVIYPSMHAILSKWAPLSERNRMATFAYSGSNVGTVISLPLSALLADNFGWEWIFYFFGTLGLCWAVLWWFMVSSTPELDPTISDAELNYIKQSLEIYDGKTRTIPWRNILTCRPLWVMALTHISYTWMFYTLSTELPKFMSEVMDFDLSTSGFISALPYVLIPITMQLSGITADYLLSRGFLTTIQVRKVFNCTSNLLTALFMIAAAYWMTPTATIVCLSLAVAFSGMAYVGFMVNHLDLAPNFAGILMGVSNTVATLSGIISPIITGYIVTNGTIDEWRYIFWLSSSISVAGSIIYGFFASCKLQHWA